MMREGWVDQHALRVVRFGGWRKEMGLSCLLDALDYVRAVRMSVVSFLCIDRRSFLHERARPQQTGRHASSLPEQTGWGRAARIRVRVGSAGLAPVAGDGRVAAGAKVTRSGSEGVVVGSEGVVVSGSEVAHWSSLPRSASASSSKVKSESDRQLRAGCLFPSEEKDQVVE